MRGSLDSLRVVQSIVSRGERRESVEKAMLKNTVNRESRGRTYGIHSWQESKKSIFQREAEWRNAGKINKTQGYLIRYRQSQTEGRGFEEGAMGYTLAKRRVCFSYEIDGGKGSAIERSALGNGMKRIGEERGKHV